MLTTFSPSRPARRSSIVDIDWRTPGRQGAMAMGSRQDRCADRSRRRCQAALDRPRHPHRGPGRALAGGSGPPPGGNHRQGRRRPPGRLAARRGSTISGRFQEGAHDTRRCPSVPSGSTTGSPQPRCSCAVGCGSTTSGMPKASSLRYVRSRMLPQVLECCSCRRFRREGAAGCL